MNLRATLCAAAAALLMLAACADDPGAGTITLDTGRPDPDAGVDASGRPDTETPDVTEGEPHLEFVSAQEIDIPIESTTELQVRYVGADGEPVEDAALRFTYDEARARDTALRTLTAQTDAEGIASVTLIAGTQAVDFEIEVSVRDSAEVSPVTFFVEISPKDATDYIVQVHYGPDGALTLSEVEIYLFNNGTSCADIPRDGTISGALDQRFTIPRSDGTYDPLYIEAAREDMPLTHAVALAYMEDQLVGFACNDGPFATEDGGTIDPADVTFGTNATINLFITELYPAIAGEYAIETEFDLVEFLPPDVQNVVRYIGTFFDSPGATIFQILYDSGVFDPGDLLGLDSVIADAVDSLLFAFLPPEAVAVFESGADIYEAIQNLRMRGRIVIFEDADENGALAPCNELVLDKIVVNFDTIEDAEFDLRARGYQAAYGTFTGDLSVVTVEGVAYVINIDPFGVSINYGELAVFILEEVVFPLVLGPDVRSMEDFVRSFFDCAQIADDIGFAPLESLCDSAIDAAVAGIVDYLTSQSVDSGSFYQLATPAEGTDVPAGIEILEEGMRWGPCELSLNPRAFKVDEFGGPGRDRCVWDARLRSGPSDPTGRPVSAGFYANTPRTLGAAVCGDGR